MANATPKPAPYAIDTKCKGWRFELDIERIQQSDTWALAALDVRPWLFMVWTTAWSQTPCGSLPSEDEILIARLGITKKFYEKNKAILLRGWWLADDGRLYHDTIVESVLSMLGKRTSEAQRKADYRKLKDTERRDEESRRLNEMSHGTDTGQTPVSHGSATPVLEPVPVPELELDKSSIPESEKSDSDTKTSKPEKQKTKKPKAEATAVGDEALQTECRSTWVAYSAAYMARYGASPIRNASVNAKVKQLVKRLGAEAPSVAEFFVNNVGDAFVVRNYHSIGMLLQGAEAYRTQWATGQTMTATRAKQIDQSQSNFDAAGEAMAILRAKRGGASQ